MKELVIIIGTFLWAIWIYKHPEKDTHKKFDQNMNE